MSGPGDGSEWGGPVGSVVVIVIPVCSCDEVPQEHETEGGSGAKTMA
jgi:hypothetical protein